MGREDPDEANVLWREAAYQSSIRQCPVAALADERGRPMWFAADEVLIGERDLALVEDFEALGAEVLPEPELPQPERMRGLRPINDAVAPRTIRMRFTRPLSEEAITQGVAAFDEAQGDTGISQASSRNAAALAGQVLRLGSGGRRQVGLNIFGEGETLPLATITEGQLNSGIIPGGNNPLAWATHDRPFRIADAWQLLESYRLRRPLGKVFVGIMDGGFWVDGNGNPLGPDSDLPPNVSRLNLMDP